MKILEKSSLQAWKKVKKLGPDKTIALLKKKGLTGRGGAGFSTGLKWELTRKTKADERFIICNADEGEPGTFKDKLLLEEAPENIIEGILIAAYCIKAKQAYIYLRGEYISLKQKLESTISNLVRNSKIKIDIIQGAGAYICGDETAIISSIENKRGYPHFKPPYPPQKGLYGKPTVINNVETLANVPLALTKKDWSDNLRLFSISGDVSKPGVYELKINSKLGQIAKLAKAKSPKAVYFGAAGGLIPYKPNLIINSENICKEEASLGSCSLIFVSKSRNILDLALNISQFFKHESCGKCTPCREGNVHVLKLLEKIKTNQASKQDIELLEKLSKTIRDTALCGLGQSCTNHVLTALNQFNKEFKTK
ncbi:MAG: NADH-ubiquinone oxidoreductase-F iron-sulfur binding region domain-containing protein [Candidatus Woesearchaeota archaeon]|jgi:NADH-quinone oxidoreductase subunit F|nr:NADH-ubiquinone oxidoreductase-F iron-sulfur binding region domain-containing protein [Candidatus Woesearchaeota archaeon]